MRISDWSSDVCSSDLYGLEDVAKLHQFLQTSEAPDAQKRIERRKLDALLGYCESVRCRRQVLLDYFGDRCEPCGNCDTCLEPVESFDGTVEAQKALSAVYRTGQRFRSEEHTSELQSLMRLSFA